MSWYETHQDFTEDVKDMSNLHFPLSCSRPPRAGHVPEGTYVEWPRLKRMAWTFVSGTYDPSASLDFICPAWWNATGCECECGDCNELFQQCPIGFMLFRALALLCDSRHDARVRIRELIANKWGCGLLNLASLRIRFIDILHSGWPYFGILARIGDQLRIDGISEPEAAQQLNLQGLLGAPGSDTDSLCSATDWQENTAYRDLLQAALEKGEVVPLEESNKALSEVACPLQHASANAAVLDWMLHTTSAAKGGAEMLSFKGLVQLEHIAQNVENKVRDWASTGSGDSCRGRPYFFELMVTAWPSWKMLQRVGVRLLSLLTLDCVGHEGPHQVKEMWIASPASSSTTSQDILSMYSEADTLDFCPACDCATQGEWAVEARWINEYSEHMCSAMFRKALCSLSGPAARLARQIIRDPFKSWYQRLNTLQMLQRSSPNGHRRKLPPLARSLPTPMVRKKLLRSSPREAFVTVLFSGGTALRQVLLHAEAIRTLAFSVRKHSLRQRPFLVVTDGALPDAVEIAFRADGISVEVVNSQDWAFSNMAYGAGSSDHAEAQSWWQERGIAPTAVKLAIWNFTAYDCLVFLDADTLLLDSVDELFEVTTFASGLNPYSQHRGYFLGHSAFKIGINTGVMVVQPSATMAADMANQMAAGLWGDSPISEHLGQSDQPWLDAFWLNRSPRFGFTRFGPAQPGTHAHKRKIFLGCDFDGSVAWGARPTHKVRACKSGRHVSRRFRKQKSEGNEMVTPSDQDAGHCMLPLEYDFFADYKTLKMHVWYETRERNERKKAGVEANDNRSSTKFWQNLSDIDYAVAQYIHTYDALGIEGPKILHWPGEMRKPWHRWRPAVRTVFDDMWWEAHQAMCKASSAPCHMRCNP